MESQAESQSLIDDSEAARVARYFLYKNRQRRCVKRSQIKIALDQKLDGPKNKGTDAVNKASSILERSLGYTIVDHNPKGKSVSTTKYFMVKKDPYLEDFPIPFEDVEKRRVGLMIILFYIIFFNNGSADLNKISSIFEIEGLKDDVKEFDDLLSFIKECVKEDYLAEKKGDSEHKTEYSLGPRFYAEFKGEDDLKEFFNEMLSTPVDSSQASQV